MSDDKTWTMSELLLACRNVGVDLSCGECASVFFTGTGGYLHTCGLADVTPVFEASGVEQQDRDAADEAISAIAAGKTYEEDREALAALFEMHRLRGANELAPLAARIAKGRTKYANGCTVLSLLDEAGEVAHAVNKYETADRVREELLDVAAVAMRLYFGEVDRGLEIDGLVQRRTDVDPGQKRSDGT